MKTIYETGATSHAVNDLILFTDNTRELAELRDEIYRRTITPISQYDQIYLAATGKADSYAASLTESFVMAFYNLLKKAVAAYKHEFRHDPESYAHITRLTGEQQYEYCRLYAEDFDNWRREHEL